MINTSTSLIFHASKLHQNHHLDASQPTLANSQQPPAIQIAQQYDASPSDFLVFHNRRPTMLLKYSLRNLGWGNMIINPTNKEKRCSISLSNFDKWVSWGHLFGSIDCQEPEIRVLKKELAPI
jgi:hypothetical protein